MHLSDETKHKLMRALPWVIGGGLLLFLLLKSRGGSSQRGSAPVQDMSMLGGGGGAPVMQQPAVVPSQVAADIGQQFASSHDRYAAMAQWWQQQGNQNGPGGQYTGVVSKAWKQLTEGGWEDRFHPGHIISDAEAQGLAGSNHGPYAQGQGNFLQQAWGALTNGLKIYANGGAPSGGFGTPGIAASGRGTMPAGNGAQRPVTGPNPLTPGQWRQIGPQL